MAQPLKFRDNIDRTLWVQMELKSRGLSFAAIGRQLGVSRTAVRLAMHSSSERLEHAIAAAIEVTPQQLFPERYTRDGRRRNPAPRASTRENTHAQGPDVHADAREAA
jgi:Ner family transcriptional regulator